MHVVMADSAMGFEGDAGVGGRGGSLLPQGQSLAPVIRCGSPLGLHLLDLGEGQEW